MSNLWIKQDPVLKQILENVYQGDISSLRRTNTNFRKATMKPLNILSIAEKCIEEYKIEPWMSYSYPVEDFGSAFSKNINLFKQQVQDKISLDVKNVNELRETENFSFTGGALVNIIFSLNLEDKDRDYWIEKKYTEATGTGIRRTQITSSKGIVDIVYSAEKSFRCIQNFDLNVCQICFCWGNKKFYCTPSFVYSYCKGNVLILVPREIQYNHPQLWTNSNDSKTYTISLEKLLTDHNNKHQREIEDCSEMPCKIVSRGRIAQRIRRYKQKKFNNFFYVGVRSSSQEKRIKELDLIYN